MNRCGPGAHAPDNPGGWCSPKTGVEAGPTAFDTSAMYMASGYVPSNSGDQIYFYSSGQAFTHGGDAAVLVLNLSPRAAAAQIARGAAALAGRRERLDPPAALLELDPHQRIAACGLNARGPPLRLLSYLLTYLLL